MGNSCCPVKNDIDEHEEYRDPIEHFYKLEQLKPSFMKNYPTFKFKQSELKTIEEEDSKQTIESCIIELEANKIALNDIEEADIQPDCLECDRYDSLDITNEKQENSYDVVSYNSILSNDNIRYCSDNSVEIV